MNNNDNLIIEYQYRKNGYFEFIVNGDCMSPLYKNGQKVKCYKYKTKISVGDIVLIRKDSKFYMHRVTLLKKDFIYTKGDKSVLFDKNIKIENIIGYVCSISKLSFKARRLSKKIAKISRKIGIVFEKNISINRNKTLKIVSILQKKINKLQATLIVLCFL